MPYYELEYTVENLADDLKKKQKAHDDEQKGQSSAQSSSMNKNPYSNLGKSINIPKMPNFKM